jgi:lipoprotein-releasing system ATP-binding protein
VRSDGGLQNGSAHNGAAPLIEVEDLRKTYFMDGRPLNVLNGISLRLERGEMIALVGKSGSGKSTFLHIAGTLDAPTSGRVRFEGQDLFSRTEEELAHFRNGAVGFVFQSHHLLPEFTALENVMMPALVKRRPVPEAERRASELLAAVGLGARLKHRPAELSGGEQQRVAIARALVLQPKLLLADEPTGNLDDATGEEIFQVLLGLNAEHGTSAIVVTHSERLASRMPRRLRLTEGRLAVEA